MLISDKHQLLCNSLCKTYYYIFTIPFLKKGMQKSVFLVIFLTGFLQPQQKEFLYTSLLGAVDAANLAIGEASVANSTNTLSYKYNPATLANYNSIGSSINVRNFGLLGKLYAINALASTPIGNFGVEYASFSGQYYFIYDPGPHPLWVIRENDITLTLSYANFVFSNFAVGTNFKFFRNKILDQENQSNNENLKTQIYFDIGILYVLDSLMNSSLSKADRLSIGLSLQNVGEKFTYYRSGEKYDMPAYLRIGLSYNLPWVVSGQDEIIGLETNIEYKRYLNPPEETFYGQEEVYGINFLNIGADIRFWEILHFRLGTSINSLQDKYSIFGEKNFRYGVGISTNLKLFKYVNPFQIKFDYSRISFINGIENQNSYTFQFSYSLN